MAVTSINDDVILLIMDVASDRALVNLASTCTHLLALAESRLLDRQLRSRYSELLLESSAELRETLADFRENPHLARYVEAVHRVSSGEVLYAHDGSSAVSVNQNNVSVLYSATNNSTEHEGPVRSLYDLLVMCANVESFWWSGGARDRGCITLLNSICRSINMIQPSTAVPAQRQDYGYKPLSRLREVRLSGGLGSFTDILDVLLLPSLRSFAFKVQGSWKYEHRVEWPVGYQMTCMVETVTLERFTAGASNLFRLVQGMPRLKMLAHRSCQGAARKHLRIHGNDGHFEKTFSKLVERAAEDLAIASYVADDQKIAFRVWRTGRDLPDTSPL